ncbi:MAG: hypothetical protein M1814_005439 [Vezdaea aestivalis]|nr:MAG: hypothetical protein M1814_005439 [Vezdaea aestivalis]
MNDIESGGQRSPTEPVFRASKRRKVYRRREDEEVENDQISSPTLITNLPEATNTEKKALFATVAEGGQDKTNLVKIRRQARGRLGGIAFKSLQTPIEPESASHEVVKRIGSDKEDGLEMMGGRFALQTGQVADVNKHMVEFIDAELAKQRLGEQQQNQHLQYTDGLILSDESVPGALSTFSDAKLHKHPATLGKLQEVDLGPSAAARNIAKTEAATTGAIEDALAGPMGRKRRRRQRRTSEDIRRDKFVEEVLGEHKISLYDEPNSPSPVDDGVEGAADDRIAEQFRREFLDAVSNRRQRAPPPPTSTTVRGAKPDEKAKGPKLGGSRSARAAMRAKEGKTNKSGIT